MSVQMQVGLNIVALRKKKAMTQEHLALKAGMSVSHLRAIEHGSCDPRVTTLIRIAAALDEPIQNILEMVVPTSL